MKIPELPDLKTIAITALVVGVAAFIGGYKVADWRLTATANGEALQRANTAMADLVSMTADRDRLAARITASDDTHLHDLKVAQNETNRLRDGLRDGSIGLRLVGGCSGTAETRGTAGSSVDSGAGEELTETARRSYFALRDGIDYASAQLAACQDQLRFRVRRDE